MGTFSVKIISVQTHIATPGEWYSYIDTGSGSGDANNYTPGNAALIANLRSISSADRYVVYSVVLKGSGGFPSFPPAMGDGTLSFLLDLATVVTDLGTLSAYQLPLGFRIATANFGPIGTNASTDFPGGTHIQRDGQDIQTYLPDTGHSTSVALSVTGSTPLSVLGSSYGVRYVSTGSPTNGFSFAFINAGSGGLGVSGTYTIIAYTWGISNGIPYNVAGTTPVIEGKIIGPGGKFEITSDNVYNASTNPTGTGPDLTLVDSIGFTWVDGTGVVHTVTVPSTDFEDWLYYFIWFDLPSTLTAAAGFDISVTAHSDHFPAIDGSGTEFSGSVKLGVLKILTTEGSGIYKLIPDQTHDTVYINNPVDNTTVNVAIPDPFAKTGFIGG